MRFQKGQSGNPGGRPKLAVTVRSYILSKSQRAAEILFDLAEHSEDDKVRFQAAKAFCEWAIGRPAVVDLNGETVRDTVIIASDTEVAAKMREEFGTEAQPFDEAEEIH